MIWHKDVREFLFGAPSSKNYWKKARKQRSSISRFQHWLLKKVIRDNIVQGPHHHSNVAEMFRLVCEASDKEFSEDNDATQYDFLRGRFEEACDATFEHHTGMRDAYKHGTDGAR